jgi:apolipoprotein N-acyltransferase
LNLLAAPAERLRRLSGWRRAAAAIMLGAFSATAFPPFYFFPALLLGLAGLALLLDGADDQPRKLRAAASIGWSFFFGQFLVGLHWIAYPFLVNPDVFLWLLPFAVTLMPAGLALFGALATLATVLLVRRSGTARLIALAVAIAATEWLRGHVLTGFPWNLPAYGWGASEAVMQSAALIGAYGLSLLTLLLGVSLADLTRRKYVLPAVMALVFVALWGLGTLRLQQPTLFVPNVSLRLVQPNIPQTEMYGAYRARNWQLLMALSRRPGNPTHIIWPESATVFALARNPQALEQIALLTGSTASLIAGSLRVDDQDRVFNTAYLFGPAGRPLGIYDKYHLVPFGEYLPLAPLLSRLGVAKLTAGETGFSAGPGPQSYALPGAPAMTPLICYEVIFPGAVTPAARPGWFVNITNDSWFGPWAGPRQHLLIARLRAIEEGLPVARSAITGISAVIDGRGKIVTSLGLNQSGVIDAGLPKALPPTPYARFGDLGFAIILLACATIAGVLSQRRQTL